MSQKLRKANTVDLEEKEIPVTDLTSEAEGMSETQATLVVSKKIGLSRSQQYKEAVIDAMNKSTKAAAVESDPEFEPDEEEEESEEEEEEEEEENVDDDCSQHDAEVKVSKLEKQMKIGKKPAFVKNLATAFNVVAPSKATGRNRHCNLSKSVAGTSRAASSSELSMVTYGVEPTNQQKRKVATQSKGASKASTAKRVPKIASSQRCPSDESDDSFDSPPKSKRKRSAAEDDELVLDFAPSEHGSESYKKMREGDVHIGLGVHVKWHRFKGTDYIMVRHFSKGVPDGRRGINIETKYLPNLKKAVDTAYKCYLEAQS